MCKNRATGSHQHQQTLDRTCGNASPLRRTATVTHRVARHLSSLRSSAPSSSSSAGRPPLWGSPVPPQTRKRERSKSHTRSSSSAALRSGDQRAASSTRSVGASSPTAPACKGARHPDGSTCQTSGSPGPKPATRRLAPKGREPPCWVASWQAPATPAATRPTGMGSSRACQC